MQRGAGRPAPNAKTRTSHRALPCSRNQTPKTAPDPQTPPPLRCGQTRHAARAKAAPYKNARAACQSPPSLHHTVYTLLPSLAPHSPAPPHSTRPLVRLTGIRACSLVVCTSAGPTPTKRLPCPAAAHQIVAQRQHHCLKSSGACPSRPATNRPQAERRPSPNGKPRPPSVRRPSPQLLTRPSPSSMRHHPTPTTARALPE